MRSAGILMPVSALPGKQGVGDFGQEAYRLVDRLSRNDIKVWQILPLNPLAYGNSPYQPYSSFAGDELYISTDGLVKDGLLKKSEAKTFRLQTSKVNYEQVRPFKTDLLKKAFARFDFGEDYRTFIDDNPWVRQYAVFRVFKAQNDGKEWVLWEDEYKDYAVKKNFNIEVFEKDIQFWCFTQYEFMKQWNALKDYAHEKGISIIGDMPFYVGLDSADVWWNQESFLLEEDGTPSFVAGVPPDYFSEFGQRWGNPIYDWAYLEDHDFDFWIKRLTYACELYDMVRIDHFRAFDTFWQVPAEEPTAIIGTWEEAPGYKVLDRFFEEMPDAKILAEDLGDLRPEVYELRDHYHFKGMFVWMFHHNTDMDMSNVVVYTGTHDNDTIESWYKELHREQKETVKEILAPYKEGSIHRKAIHACLDSESELVIIPMWDLLGLGRKGRFNTPGTIGYPNWSWKLSSMKLMTKDIQFYRRLIKKTGRA